MKEKVCSLIKNKLYSLSMAVTQFRQNSVEGVSGNTRKKFNLL